MYNDNMKIVSKRNLFRFAVLAGVSMICMIALELALRSASPTYRRMHSPPHPFFLEHPTRGHALEPGFQGETVWEVPFRVNSLGLRGPEIAANKPPGVKRVLVLGDSIAMGSGLTEDALVSARIEEILSKAHGAGSWQVLNGGVAGYDIEDEYKVIEEERVILDPDVVALVLCLNDIPGTTAADHIHLLRDLPIPAKEFLLNNTATALIVQSFYNRIGLEDPDPLPAWLDGSKHPPTRERVEAGWSRFALYFSKIARLCDSRQIDLIVVLVPHAAQFEEGESKFTPQHRLTILALRNNLKYIDLAPVFADEPELPYIFPDPVHPNPRGHELMALEIFKAMEERHEDK